MPEYSWKVRKATKADAPAILGSLRVAFEPYRDRYTPEGFTDTVLTSELLTQRFTTMTLFVATDDASEIVGTIGCQALASGEGHIRGMAVLPAWRGSGVANQLLKVAELELHVQGCTWVSLDTTEPLAAAQRFYEKNGYRRSGKIADFFGMPLFEYTKSLSN